MRISLYALLCCVASQCLSSDGAMLRQGGVELLVGVHTAV